jgi:hypothetical protein
MVLAADSAGGIVDDTGRVSRRDASHGAAEECILTPSQIPHTAGPLRQRASAQDQPIGADSLRCRAPHGRLLIHSAALLRVSQ